MKNKLYVFGCSFAWTPEDTRTWSSQIAKHFNLELVNTGFPGQGILQHFKNWQDLEKDMKPGDMNIISLSSTDRTYFFPQAPYFSQFAHAEAPNILDNLDSENTNKIKEAIPAYIDYFKYLHNPDHYLWFVKCWLRWLDAKSKMIGTKTIVIPAFDELLPALQDNFENLLIFQKTLTDISQSEYADEKFEKVFNGPYDLRANHLCFSNHSVLAKKVIESINIGYVKDSFSGWHSKLINDENILQQDWCNTNFHRGKFDEKFFYGENIYDKIMDHLVRGDY